MGFNSGFKGLIVPYFLGDIVPKLMDVRAETQCTAEGQHKIKERG